MKKWKYIFFVLSIFIISSCGKKEEVTEIKEVEKIVTEEITNGTIDGYTFEETEEVTDRVKIQMQNGDIMLIVLSNKDTPITIANFKKIVQEKYYDGLIFHRIVKDFMIQGGANYSKPVDKIKGEFALNGVSNSLSHTKGVISMARGGDYNSASNQFFICTSDNYINSLNGRYAAFGKVFAGWDALDKLNNTEVDGETPVKQQVIKSIRFINIKAS